MPMPLSGPTSGDRLPAVPFAIGLGTMIVAFHASAMTATLPVIARQTGSTIVRAEWFLTTYTLVLSACLIGFGRLGDRVGLKAVYLTGLAVFTVASSMCALAPNTTVLITLRAVQGIGAAMISTTSVALLASNLGLSRLGQALGWQTGMTYLGLAAGPVIAGLCVDRFGWRSLFLLNVPAGIIAMVVAARVVQGGIGWRGSPKASNGLASVAWIATVVPLLMGLSGVRAWGWLSFRSAEFFIAAAIGGAAFVLLNSRSADPLIDLKIFRNVAFSIATATETAYYLCLYGAAFLMPLYLIQVRKFSAAETGFFIGCQSVARAIAAPCSGALTDRAGARMLTGVGSVILAVTMFCLCQLDGATSTVQILVTLILLGTGTGLFVPANSATLLASAPPALHGMATGVLATARNIGMTLGVAIAAAAYAGYIPGQGNSADSVLVAVRGSFAVITVFAFVNALTGIVGTAGAAPVLADKAPEPS